MNDGINQLPDELIALENVFERNLQSFR